MKKVNKPKSKETNKETNTRVYMLIDRSGSMRQRWEETINALNSYVKELADDKKTKDAIVDIMFFDNANGILDINHMRKKAPVKSFENISPETLNPRGMTPLYDAINYLFITAEKDNTKKATIVIMTDGEENCSKEVNKSFIKNLIKNNPQYDVVFIGADFNAFGESQAIGLSIGDTINISTGNYTRAMSSVKNRTMSYAMSNVKSSFTQDDRNNAIGI